VIFVCEDEELAKHGEENLEVINPRKEEDNITNAKCFD